MARTLVRPGVHPLGRHWVLVLLQGVLLVTLFAFLVALGDRHNLRFDLTPLQTYSISDQSKRIAEGLRHNVRILAFFDGRDAGRRRQLADVLDQFTAASARISYQLYDLDRTPGLAKKYDVSGYNSGAVEARGKVYRLASIDEIAITGTLLKVSRVHARTLCFFTGHGEHSPMNVSDRRGYNEVAKELERENFDIRTLELVPETSDLSACTVAILPGPERDLLAKEVEFLSAYLEGGGKVLVLADGNAPPTVAAFLERFGVRLRNDLIVDERNRLYGADAFMARVPIFDEQTFGSKLELAAVFSLAQSLEPVEPPPDGTTVALVALSGPDSWARTGAGAPSEEPPRFRPDRDRNGPLPVGATVTVENADTADAKPAGMMAVFGDSDFASNLHVNLMGNKDLFMSTVAVLAEDEELVAVRRKGQQRGSFSPIYLTAREGQMIFSLSVIVVPALTLVAGTAIVWRRRRKGR